MIAEENAQDWTLFPSTNIAHLNNFIETVLSIGPHSIFLCICLVTNMFERTLMKHYPQLWRTSSRKPVLEEILTTMLQYNHAALKTIQTLVLSVVNVKYMQSIDQSFLS